MEKIEEVIDAVLALAIDQPDQPQEILFENKDNKVPSEVLKYFTEDGNNKNGLREANQDENKLIQPCTKYTTVIAKKLFLI